MWACVGTAMKVWNDCIEIYKDGNFVDDFAEDILSAWQLYTAKICKKPQLNVWFDTKTGICFGPEQDYHIDKIEFSFFAQSAYFLNDSTWGKEKILHAIGKVMGTSIKESDEFIIQDFEPLKKFKDKTVLIVGAGPTAIDRLWESIPCDYIWSCNAFYMYPRLAELSLGLVALEPRHKLDNTQIVEHFSRFDTICAIEASLSHKRTKEELQEFKHQFPGQIFYYHLRYFSHLGTIPRLVCLATFLGVKCVYVVGMDGFPVNQDHAFEGKCKRHVGAPLVQGAEDRYRREFVVFWDYLLHCLQGYNVEFQNLGEGHPANQSTDISSQEFPLTILQR